IASWRESPFIDQLIDMDDLMDNDGQVAPVPIDPNNDIAVLQYTGGTTGQPKGAMLTHTNLSVNVEQISMWAPELVPGEECLMGILPFFHVFGMTVVIITR
ncbi:MAG: AMP-binding protein, partial [Alphaproteobacteria bacterium]